MTVRKVVAEGSKTGMITVFVVTLIDYYSDPHHEILGVAATMAEGKSMAEKKLQELIKGKYDWYENSGHESLSERTPVKGHSSGL